MVLFHSKRHSQSLTPIIRTWNACALSETYVDSPQVQEDITFSRRAGPSTQKMCD